MPWVVVNNQPLQEVGRGNEYNIKNYNNNESIQLLYVVMINYGTGLQHMQDFPNFLTYICKAYGGTHIPEVCRSMLLEQQEDSRSFKQKDFENLVCYNNNGESTNVTLSHRH